MDSARRLPFKHIVQREIGRLLSPVWTPIAVLGMRFGMGYRIHGLAAVREKFARIRRESRKPLLICANHLTMIDSFLVAWALSPTWRYVLHYDELPWNVPESRNFASNLWERLWSWVMKCIPITRGGSLSPFSSRRFFSSWVQSGSCSRNETARCLPSGDHR